MHRDLFIDGEFVPAAAGDRMPVINPHDGSTITEVSLAGAEDVSAAVRAAKKAFPAWSRRSASERGRLLLKLADAIESNADELARLESLDTGHPLRDTQRMDVPRTAQTFRYFGGMADKFEGAVIPCDHGFLNFVQREPIGIVAQVAPWNLPLVFTASKLAPALAAGNCLILKPSEITPLTSLQIAALAAEVGIPKGVVNVLPGVGSAGAALAEHPDIGKISFTGSTAVGRSVVHASAQNLKRVQLELGGKGANIVFDDANLDAAVAGSAFAIFQNQGQACIAGSRLILHRAIASRFLAKFLSLARSIRVGNPLDPATEMGPLTSASHRDRVLGFLQIARDQGGSVLTGGGAPADASLSRGFYVEPTVVQAQPTDRISQEEVFGPVVTVCEFDSEEQALDIANGTQYGLGGGLWTRDLQRAHRFARELRAGMVWVNCYKRGSPASPFGGIGASGYGREMGFEAMHEYTQPKSVWMNVDAQIPAFYPR